MRFSYVGTEDATVQKCFLMPNKCFVGYVQKVPGGFRMRRTDVDLWSRPAPQKHEVARQLFSLVDSKVS